jgi:transposase
MKKNTAQLLRTEVGVAVGLTEDVTVGLDIGDEYSYSAVLDPKGKLLQQGRILTTRKALTEYFSVAQRLRVVLEAGTHSRWISRLLEGLGHEVIVANPRRLKLIYQSDSKTDSTDAESLARLGRIDPKLLSPIFHRSEQAQADLSVVRSRDVLVESRTKMVNSVRGMVKGFGGRLKKCSTSSFHRQARESAEFNEALKPALMPVLDMIERLTQEIARFDRLIEQIAITRYPETKRLRQLSGVGALTSLAYVLTLEDPHRFPRSRKVGSYVGLRSRKNQSGKGDPELRITKAGDSMLRRLLVNSAHYILGPFGPDCDLRRWGLKLAARGGKNAKKRAVVAVARKLAVLLHRLWVTGADYDPLRNAKRLERRAEIRAIRAERQWLHA